MQSKKRTAFTILIFLGVHATAPGIASSAPGPAKVTGRGQAEGRLNCWGCADRLEEQARLEARRNAADQCGNHMPPALFGDYTITDTHLGLGRARITAVATFLCPQW